MVGRPVRVGEKFELEGSVGLEQQTGLNLPLSLKGFYRQLDVSSTDTPLDDKLFVVYQAEWNGEKLADWPQDNFAWKSVDEFKVENNRFDSAVEMLTKLESKQLWFVEGLTKYQDNEF